MGYCTYYNLTVLNPDLSEPDEETSKNIITVLRLNNEELKYAVEEDGCGSPEETKWYDHTIDMCDLSKLYPDYIFMLQGTGEEPGDFWKGYYKNGMYHIVEGRVVYEPYDQGLLEFPDA